MMCSILLLVHSCMSSRLHMHAQFGEPVSYKGLSYVHTHWLAFAEYLLCGEFWRHQYKAGSCASGSHVF